MGRFSFRKNINYDLALLTEVHSLNPFSEKSRVKANEIWGEIAKNLKESTLKLDVTFRNCKKRTMELLKEFRQKEALSVKSSGVAEAEMGQIKELLTNLMKLEDDSKSEISMKKLYAKKSRSDAELTKVRALNELESSDEEVQDGGQDDDNDDDEGNDTDQQVIENNSSAIAEEPIGFDPSLAKKAKRTTTKRSAESTIVDYLKSKNKVEVELKNKELDIRAKEAENRALELQLAQQKQVAEMEERKRMNDFIFGILNKNQI